MPLPASEASAPAQPAEPQSPPPGIPPDAPEEVKEALTPPPRDPEDEPSEEQIAEGKKEVAVLDYLLGKREPHRYQVKAELIVGEESGVLTFIFHQVDGDRILALETEYTVGAGPFAQIDRFGLNAAIAAEAVVLLRDETGREINPKQAEWILPFGATPVEAWRAIFKLQFGILDGLVAEIRLMSGFGSRAVGQATKVEIAETVGNS